MKKIQITVDPGANFTPAGLMQRYAKETPGVEYQNTVYGAAKLAIRGAAYVYHHWNIDGETVTLFLADAGLNRMCWNCMELGKSCDGTEYPLTMTGCPLKKEGQRVKIWYFEGDPEMGFVKAGYTVNGKRYVSLVWSQAGQLYVSTGAKITGDLVFHWFSEKQTAAYKAFCEGSKWAVEFKEGI